MNHHQATDEASKPVTAQIDFYELKGDRARAHRHAARSRKIATKPLLEMFQEQFSLPSGAAEADLPKKLLAIKPLSAQKEHELVMRWKHDRCEESRQTVLLSVFARQFKYLLKKQNVGGDLMDMLQEAAIEAMERLDSPSAGETEKFQTAGLLAAIRARNSHHLSMSRQVSSRIGIEQKKAMAAVLAFDFEDIKSGAITAEMASGGRSVKLDAVENAISFLTAEDVDSGDEGVGSLPSHEEDTLVRFDLRRIAPAVMHALDDRARDIIIRRWLLKDRQDAEDLAETWNISPERVRQIERQSLADMRTWIEGGVTSLEASRRRKALAQRRKDARKSKRLNTDRRSIKGVDLIAARPALAEMLTPREISVLEARYFSGDRVPTYREIEPQIGVTGSTACVIEAAALDLLRNRFPAFAQD